LESPPKYGCQRKNQKVKLYHNQSHEALW
jgi:hypothetical protein